MENAEQSFTCDLCEKNLRDHFYKVNAYQYDGLNVTCDWRYRLCQECSPKVQSAIKKALAGVLKDMLLEATVKLKQELQAAGKI